MNIKAKIQEAVYNYDWTDKIESAFKKIDLNGLIREKIEEYITNNFDIQDLIESALENAIDTTIEDSEIEEMLLETIEENITAPW